MCVIIDANVRDRVLSMSPTPEAIEVIRWIEEKQGSVVYGGTKLCEELLASRKAIRAMRTWKQAGRAYQFPDDLVDGEAHRIRGLGVAKSDDFHILALARISGARTLYSSDQALHDDFKNPRLVSDPGGAVYQRVEHSHLLSHTNSCRSGLARLSRIPEN